MDMGSVDIDRAAEVRRDDRMAEVRRDEKAAEVLRDDKMPEVRREPSGDPSPWTLYSPSPS